jgi:hypothetical protein
MSDFTVSDAVRMNQATLASEISTRVAVKTQDVAKQQGEAAVALIQSAMQNVPDPSGNRGTKLDVTA